MTKREANRMEATEKGCDLVIDIIAMSENIYGNMHKLYNPESINWNEVGTLELVASKFKEIEVILGLNK